MPEYPISANDRFIQYIATAGQTVFPYDFPIFDQTHLKVLQNGTEIDLTTDYTVSGVDTEAGGNVTLVVGATLDDVITILGDTPVSRASDFNQAGDFTAASINRELDLITQYSQQQARDIDKKIGLAETSTATGVILPDPEASKFIAWNSAGTQLENTTGLAGPAGPTGPAGADGEMAGPGVSVDSEVALFDGTTGTTLKRATGTGFAKVVDGVLQTPVATINGTDIAMGSDAAGDILYHNGTNYVRLPKGTAGQKLQINAGATAPEWVTVSSGLFTSSYTSAEQTITTSGTLTLAHGLGVEPKIIQGHLVCKTAEFGYSIGDKVSLPPSTTLTTRGYAIQFDSTNLEVHYGNETAVMRIITGGGGTAVTLTNGNWRLVVTAYA